MKTPKDKSISELIKDHRNANKHSEKGMQMLRDGIIKNGLGRSILLSADDEIIAGNGVTEAAEKIGIKNVKIIETDGTEIIAVKRTDIKSGTKEFYEMALSDNIIAKENIVMDAEVVDAICEEYGIEDYKTQSEQAEAQEDDYEIPDEIKTDIVLGDLFEIGPHRLLCGDSTDSDAVHRLMNGQKADISFTSPPYNAGKTPTEAKTGKQSKYSNDDDNRTADEYLYLLSGFTQNALINSIYTFVNVQSIAGNKTTLIEYLHIMKDVYADTLIWQKQNAQPAMAKNVLNSQFEYIHCFSEKANRAIGVKQFRGTLSNVIQIQKQTNNDVKSHSATFPVAFAAYFVENFSIQSVLDLFLGTGTTMVAAHQLNRKCYGMELDPKYCQVIIDRMQKLDPDLKITRNGKPYEVKPKA